MTMPEHKIPIAGWNRTEARNEAAASESQEWRIRIRISANGVGVPMGNNRFRRSTVISRASSMLAP